MVEEESDCDGEKYLVSMVEFATCEKCPAGGDGGLCQHVFALLIVMEHYGPRKTSSELPGPQSVTSQQRTWGIRTRNVTPKPVMHITFEKSKLDSERKGKAIDCSLYEARGVEVRRQSTGKEVLMGRSST